MLRLQEIMESKKITAKELAEKSNVSQVAISNILTEKSSPKVETLLKFSKVLGVNIREFFDPIIDGENIPIYIKDGESLKEIGEIKKGSV